MNRPEPPRGATALLRCTVAQGETYEGILGDLTEEFHERRERLGRRRAAAWFWIQSMWIAALFLFAPGSGWRRTPERRRIDWLGELGQAVRSLRRASGFTTIAVGILALGIGMATTMVIALDAVLLRDLPVIEPDRIVTLSLQRGSTEALPLFPDDVDAFAQSSRTVQGAAGVSSFGTASMPVTERDRGLALDMTMVTAGFFDLLGVRPVLGRLLRPQDGEDAAPPVAVISYGTWQGEFGGGPDVLGRRLVTTSDQRSYEIVGVAPPGLDYPVGVDYWTVFYPRPILSVVARLAPGATAELAHSEFLSITRTFDRVQSEEGPVGASVRSLEEAVLGEVRPILVAIAAAVGLLLLITCVNVSNLLLMRAAGRSGEVVVRRALGASYGGMARVFLIESVVLGVAGGALGLGLAVTFLRFLPALTPGSFPRTDTVGLVGSPLAAAIGVTLTTVAMFGVLPALAAARGNLASALRVDGRSGRNTRHRRRLQRSLVASQAALTILLLVGAGLLTRSLQHLARLDLGYEVEGLSIMEIGVSYPGYRGSEVGDMFAEVFERLRAMPGVTALTPIMSRPFIGSTGILEARPLPEGRPEGDAEEYLPYPLEIGGQDYFRTLGIPILRGRGFEEGDGADAPRVAVVSEAVAARLWPGEDPIGKRMRGLVRDGWWTVVGLAADTRFRGLREPTPTIYLPWQQFQVIPGVLTVAVRTDSELASVLPGMREAVRAFDPDFHIWRADTMGDYLAAGPLAQPRMSAVVLSGFALAALLLAALGLYGVTSLAVRERTHDLGVRSALGATGKRLQREVLGDALAITAVGGTAGLLTALPAAHLLRSLLFEVGPADPLTWAGACAALLGVSVLAASLPARRATRVDPCEALRAN